MGKPKGRFRSPTAERWRHSQHWADSAWEQYAQTDEMLHGTELDPRLNPANQRFNRDEVYRELQSRATVAEAKRVEAEARLEAVERALDEDRERIGVASGVRLSLLRGAIKDALGREADDAE